MVLAHGGEIGWDELAQLGLLSLPVMAVFVVLVVRLSRGR